ncbi:hypothetical protein KC343_g5455 [Hortaea werneckii]|nr:hypothetical protein KC352_g12150 [Hortaea werneckii]KAI7570485.1 hypothetical protein KC317_g2422 [Hortaea werneckii]KAI7617740.1 hypothetical protein KC346_g5313 [Hortaea werneckii]KAI7629047.1 hypothetical protein KC343_g5455 [Hortaea werneckii]KAI7671981.1 hypothetical protein KC319_g5433 [Hortaea werneckii]
MGPKPRKVQGKGVAKPVKPTKRAATGWASKQVTELKDELRSRKLKVGGNKAELVARLEEDDAGKDTAEGEKEPENPQSSGKDVATVPKKLTAQTKKEKAAIEEPPARDKPKDANTDKAQKPTSTKTPPKKTPKNGFKSSKHDQPTAPPTQAKTTAGRIEKPKKTTKTEKARAKKYLAQLATIMQDLKQELGGGAKYRDTVFKKAYEDIGVAADLLSAIEEAEDVEVKRREKTPEEEEGESVEASEESNAPDEEAWDEDYVSDEE